MSRSGRATPGVRALFHAPRHEVGRFAAEIEVSVYRIAQEALHNVAKHARARSVNVLLETRGDSVVVVIEDDGIGFQGRGVQRTDDRPDRDARTRRRCRRHPGHRAHPGRRHHRARAHPDGPAVSASRPMHEETSDDHRGAAPLSDSSLAVADTSGTVLTSMRARLQELQHAVAARDEFIATVAHELRNPVAPLMFQLRLAIEKAEHMAPTGGALPSEWVQSQLRRIEQRLHRLLETLDRLLDVSRLSTGRIDLQLEPMDLARVVRDVISTFDAELTVARCPLGLDGTAGGHRFMGCAPHRADLPQPGLQCDSVWRRTPHRHRGGCGSGVRDAPGTRSGRRHCARPAYTDFRAVRARGRAAQRRLRDRAVGGQKHLRRHGRDRVRGESSRRRRVFYRQVAPSPRATGRE